MLEIGSRARRQPPSPHVVFEALTQPDRDPARPWLRLRLLDDEQVPQVLQARPPGLVVWSSLWTRRPDARVRFDVLPAGAETSLRWTLLVEEPAPDPSLTGHLRERLNQLVNADLRHTFGQ